MIFRNPESMIMIQPRMDSTNRFKLAIGKAGYFKGIVNPQMRVVKNGTNRTVMTTHTIADVFLGTVH
jgi:hypothetical protein